MTQVERHNGPTLVEELARSAITETTWDIFFPKIIALRGAIRTGHSKYFCKFKGDFFVFDLTSICFFNFSPRLFPKRHFLKCLLDLFYSLLNHFPLWFGIWRLFPETCCNQSQMGRKDGRERSWVHRGDWAPAAGRDSLTQHRGRAKWPPYLKIFDASKCPDEKLNSSKLKDTFLKKQNWL